MKFKNLVHVVNFKTFVNFKALKGCMFFGHTHKKIVSRIGKWESMWSLEMSYKIGC
ncbi:hypothetical protein FQR65_LT08284 [Abscondita terminalis]|nr:hypothetical protein FQR65_LT08284 [Abscondita terminalis]